MNTRLTLLTAGLAAALTGCPEDPKETPDNTLTQPVVSSFIADPSIITMGTTHDGNEVQGAARLTWDVTRAERVRVVSAGLAISLDDCVPDPGKTCQEGGGIEVEPQADTTFTLEALGTPEGDCTSAGELCVTAEVNVAIRPPALAILSTNDEPIVLPGDSVTVSYDISQHESFELGLLQEDGSLMACALDTDADTSAAPCVLTTDDEGAPMPAGELTFSDIQEGFTFTAHVLNGAEDGLGDILPGDLTVTFALPGEPTVLSFDAEDTTARPGDTLVLSWSTLASTAVEITVDPEDAILADELAACNAVDAAGEGTCNLVIQETDVDQLSFILIATGVDAARSTPDILRIDLGDAPAITGLAATPNPLPEGGGDVTLAWTANDANHVYIARDDSPETAILDTEAGVGACLNDPCDANDGATEITGITANTGFIVILSNDFGASSKHISVAVAGGPLVSALDIGDHDLLADPLAIVDASTASLDYGTADATSTTLEMAARLQDGCASADTVWEADSGFAGDTSGSHSVNVADGATCFRITALGAANQLDAKVFELIRRPYVDAFASDDTSVKPGDDLELSWTVGSAGSVSITANPAAAFDADSLAACTAVTSNGTGQCTITVTDAAASGDATLQLVAHGLESSMSDAMDLPVVIGVPPVVDTFTATPNTLTSTGSVTLNWTTSDATAIVISDDSGEVFSSTDAGVVASGSTTINGVSATTTWNILASSDFGDVQASVTAFFGPSIDTFEIAGDDALDGSASVLSGDVSVAWTATNADSAELESAPLPTSGNCADASGFQSSGSGGGSDSATIASVASDLCVRLTVSNTGGQSSAVVAHMADMPAASAFTTSPDTQAIKNGGTVTIDMSVSGAERLTLRATYLDDQGNSNGTEVVCREDSLSSGTITDDAGSHDVQCEHTHGPEICVGNICSPSSSSIPRGTAAIHYTLTLRDIEMDETVIEIEESEQVTVTP